MAENEKLTETWYFKNVDVTVDKDGVSIYKDRRSAHFEINRETGELEKENAR